MAETCRGMREECRPGDQQPEQGRAHAGIHRHPGNQGELQHQRLTGAITPKTATAKIHDGHRQAAWYFTIAMMLVVAALPWPFTHYGRPLLPKW